MRNKKILIYALVFISFISIAAADTIQINATQNARLECAAASQGTWNNCHDDTTGDGNSQTNVFVSSFKDGADYKNKRVAVGWDMTSFTTLGESATKVEIVVWLDESSSITGGDDVHDYLAFVLNYTGSAVPQQADYDNCGFVDNPIVITPYYDFVPEVNGWYQFEVHEDYHYIIENSDTLYLCLRSGWDINDTDPSTDKGFHYIVGDLADNEAMYFNITYSSGAPTPALTVTTEIDTNGEYIEDPLIINYTGEPTATTNIFNCSLYINDTLNSTDLNINISQTQNFSVNVTNWEQEITVNITCSNNNATGSVLKTGVYIDTIQPDETTEIYSTVIYINYSAANFYYNVTIFDNNLYAFNISFLNTTYGAITNIFNESYTNTTYNNYTAINLNAYLPGTYYLHVQAWDDHNPVKDEHEKVKKLDFKEGNATLEFEGGYFRFLDPNIKEYELLDEDNKYKEKIKFNDLSGVMTVLSNTPLRYRSDSVHKAHFVSLSMNKYRDLDHEDLYIDLVEKISDYEYRVHYHLDSKNLITNSIGDLNTINSLYNITLSDSFYIYARENDENTSIDTFSVTVNNGSWTFTQNTTTSVVILNITHGNYSTNISGSTFNSMTEYINFSAGGNHTFYVNLTNAFTVYIRDQLTNALIQPQTVYLECIGTNSSNYSTTTGVKFITDLLPDDYIIRYSSANYSNAFHYFTLVNGTNVRFTIYMIPNVTGTIVTLYVYDEFSEPVEEAEIHIYRYNKILNSYVLVNTLKTDFEGKSRAALEIDNEFYRFYVYYNDVIKLQTAPAYIVGTELTFEINIGEPVLQEFFNLGDVQGYVSFNDLTDNFRFYYNDLGSSVTRGCLKVYKLDVNEETLHNETCVDSVSALLLLNAANVSGTTYIAKGYVTISGSEYFFDSFTYTFETSTDMGNLGLFLVFILTIVAMFIAFWDLSVGLILIPIPMFIGSLSSIKWINLPTNYAVGMEVIAVVLAFIVSRRN